MVKREEWLGLTGPIGSAVVLRGAGEVSVHATPRLCDDGLAGAQATRRNLPSSVQGKFSFAGSDRVTCSRVAGGEQPSTGLYWAGRADPTLRWPRDSQAGRAVGASGLLRAAAEPLPAPASLLELRRAEPVVFVIAGPLFHRFSMAALAAWRAAFCLAPSWWSRCRQT